MAEIDAWNKIGVAIGAAALLLTYLGVAGNEKWWPFEHAPDGNAASAFSSPTLPASPTAPATESDQTLTSQLSDQYFGTSDCQGESDQQSGINALAAVICPAHQENGNAPVEEPLIIQFANGSDLTQWFNANTSGFPQSNGCDSNGYIGMWHNPSGKQGQGQLNASGFKAKRLRAGSVLGCAV